MTDSAANALVRSLVQIGLLTELPPEKEYLKRSEKPIHLLANKGAFDETEAIDRLASKLGIAIANQPLEELINKVKAAKFGKALQVKACWRHKVVPLYFENNAIVAAFANPFDNEAKHILEFMLQKPIITTIAKELLINRILESCFKSTMAEYDQMDDLACSQVLEILPQNQDQEEVDPKKALTPPIIRLCNKILNDAIEQNASDIHIEPTEQAVDIRLRIDGKMSSLFQAPKRLQNHMLSRFKLLAAMDLAEKRRPQDGRIHIRWGERSIDVRVSSIPNSYGEKLVLRLLAASESQLSIASLGMPKPVHEALSDTLNKRGKMILVTGPTGSGKTTTLYSCLRHLCDGSTNIQTVEDPIEYQLDGINQVQVNKSIDLNFSEVLRTVLRQDPDVIMVGEIRDFATAEVAFQAAQTGHLVLSTLHTNDALATVSRLVDIGVESFALSSGLALILAQRLVRALCGECRIELDDEERAQKLQELGEKAADPTKLNKLWSAKGCHHCGFTGYKGRIGIFSALQITPALADLIYNGCSRAVLLEQARSDGFVELHEAALELLYQEKSSIQEILPYLEEANKAINLVNSQEPSQVQDTNTKLQTASETPSNTTIRRQKIMLVEDSEEVRQVLSLLLEQEMYEVIEACDGKEALDLVFENVPDIILCDLMMPRMDGREFLKKMKAHPNLSNIPIVMLTAADSEENEIGLLDLGAKDFVSKTSSSNVMLTRIRRILSQ